MMELLVAMTISGLLVTVIFQLLQGNGRYVQMQSAREEVQQNARVAAELIASDLRMVPPGAIQGIGTDSVRFFLPRAWGVLCDTVTASTTTAWAIFPVGTSANPADVFARAHWGMAIEQTTDPSVHTGGWSFVQAPTRQTTGDRCSVVQPGVNAATHVTLGFNRPTGTAFLSATALPSGSRLMPGTQVLLYEEMRYDVAASASSPVPGSWIRRMVGYNGTAPNMQPMAGPVPTTGALRFEYIGADGVTTVTSPAAVRRVNVQVVAQSRAQSGTGANRRPDQMDTISTAVYLRNAVN